MRTAARIALAASLAWGCETTQPATPPSAAPTAALDAGPPMVPLGPRDESKYAPPPCDPEWRPFMSTPPLGALVATSDGRLVALTWGYAAVAVEGEWVEASVPEIELGRDRRVVFQDAASFDGDVYVVGTRLTVLRWDGVAWSLEHQDVSLGPRRFLYGSIRDCEGQLEARVEVGGVRGPDGAWRRVSREALRCPQEVPRTPRPDERCGRHTPWDRVVRCAAGWRLWSAARERWLPLPDGFAEGRLHARPSVYEDETHVYVATDEGVLLETTDDGASWDRVLLGGESRVSVVLGGGGRIYAAGAETVFVREVCAPR